MALANKTKLAGILLGFIFSVGLVTALCDEAVRIYHSWANTQGTAVPGYGLYEKQIPTVTQKMGLKLNLPTVGPNIGPEMVDFYQWSILCGLNTLLKQRAWHGERKRLLELRRTVDGPDLSAATDDVDRVLRLKAWREARKSKGLADTPITEPIFSENDLPIEKYSCVPTTMYYQPGMGWGVF